MTDCRDDISRWLQARPFQDNPRRLQAPLADSADAWNEWVTAGKAISDVDGGLIQMLMQERDPVTRSAAALALGFVVGEEAVQPLITALRSDEPLVAMEAAASLGRLGKIEAVEPLCAALGHEDANVRANACTALGMLKGERALACLKSAEDDRDPFVRAAAMAALKKNK